MCMNKFLFCFCFLREQNKLNFDDSILERKKKTEWQNFNLKRTKKKTSKQTNNNHNKTKRIIRSKLKKMLLWKFWMLNQIQFQNQNGQSDKFKRFFNFNFNIYEENELFSFKFEYMLFVNKRWRFKASLGSF